jgi:hypothetical protein|tara:strand:- start:2881 stop:3756 length:876 start_codon:yes stop_codon:yes gene_type:complete
MSIHGDTPYGSVNIFLQSSKATTSISEANKIFYLENPINPPPNTRILMVLSEFEMPNAIYNINSGRNNLISFTTINGSATISLNSGNYDDETIVSNLNSKLSDTGIVATLGTTIVASFSELNCKYSFTASVAFSIISTNSNATTLLKELGLTNQLPTPSGTSYTATLVGDLGGLANIYLRTNFGVANLDSRGESDGLIAKVNVDVPFSDYIYFEPPTTIEHLLTDRQIREISVKLEDVNETELIINGVEFSLTFSVHFQYQRELRKLEEYTLPHSLTKQDEILEEEVNKKD